MKANKKGPVDPPSSDAFASMHTVEIDRGDHTELQPFGAWMPDPRQPTRPGRAVRPGDDIRERGTILLRTDLIEAAGADPERCVVMETLEGCRVPLEPGERGLYEYKGDGRVRFLGHIREFQRGIPPEALEDD